jgi:hypothetical protein
VTPRRELVNMPQEVVADGLTQLPEAGKPLAGPAFEKFVAATAQEVARRLGLEKR